MAQMSPAWLLILLPTATPSILCRVAVGTYAQHSPLALRGSAASDTSSARGFWTPSRPRLPADAETPPRARALQIFESCRLPGKPAAATA